MWADLLRQSVAAPRQAAARLLSLGLSTREAAEALALVVLVETLATVLLSGGQVAVPVSPEEEVMLGPFGSVAVIGFCLLGGALTLAGAGRALGGRGDPAGAMTVTAWLQVVSLVLQVGLLLLAALLPVLAPLALLALLALMLWISIGFVQELHGVPPGRALAILVLSVLGLGLALVLVLSVAWSPPDA